MIDHPPLDLIHPVPYRGTVATRLTIGNLGSPAVERALAKASRIQRARPSMIRAVAAGCEVPTALVAKLSTVDLARAADWVAQAFEKESQALWQP